MSNNYIRKLFSSETFNYYGAFWDDLEKKIQLRRCGAGGRGLCEAFSTKSPSRRQFFTRRKWTPQPPQKGVFFYQVSVDFESHAFIYLFFYLINSPPHKKIILTWSISGRLMYRCHFMDICWCFSDIDLFMTNEWIGSALLARLEVFRVLPSLHRLPYRGSTWHRLHMCPRIGAALLARLREVRVPAS